MQIETNGLDMSLIHPKRNPKYSPNLFKWLNHRDHESRKWASRVYRHKLGALYIGLISPEMDFLGTRLMAVLCEGAKADSFCHIGLGKHMEEIEGFWGSYIEDGRCAIDPDHQLYFIGEETRWKVEGDSRACLWCGKARQILSRWTELVERKAWVAA